MHPAVRQLLKHICPHIQHSKRCLSCSARIQGNKGRVRLRIRTQSIQKRVFWSIFTRKPKEKSAADELLSQLQHGTKEAPKPITPYMPNISYKDVTRDVSILDECSREKRQHIYFRSLLTSGLSKYKGRADASTDSTTNTNNNTDTTGTLTTTINVLDIGCGSGEIMKEIFNWAHYEKENLKVNVYGIDYDDKWMEHLKNRYSVEIADNKCFVDNVDIRDLSQFKSYQEKYNGIKFDIIITRLVLGYVNQEQFINAYHFLSNEMLSDDNGLMITQEVLLTPESQRIGERLSVDGKKVSEMKEFEGLAQYVDKILGFMSSALLMDIPSQIPKLVEQHNIVSKIKMLEMSKNSNETRKEENIDKELSEFEVILQDSVTFGGKNGTPGFDIAADIYTTYVPFGHNVISKISKQQADLAGGKIDEKNETETEKEKEKDHGDNNSDEAVNGENESTSNEPTKKPYDLNDFAKHFAMIVANPTSVLKLWTTLSAVTVEKRKL